MNNRKRPIKKKKKNPDPNYRQGQGRKSHKTNAAGTLAMRCDTSYDASTLKMACMINTDPISTRHPLEDIPLDNIFTATFENSMFRPVWQVSEYSEAGSPVSIITPNKTLMKRGFSADPVNIYYNIDENSSTPSSPEGVVTEAIDSNHPYFKSDVYKKLCAWNEKTKSQIFNLSKKTKDKAARERAKNGGQRSVSQNSVAGSSATVFASEAGLQIKGIKWEWLHLVAHQFIGKDGQNIGNLVGGTKHANTNMIFVEQELHQLIERYPEGFTLKIEAEMVAEGNQQNTSNYLQAATVIKYKIITKDFEVEFTFNAQEHRQPLKDFQIYFKTLFTLLLKSGDRPEKENKTPPIGENYSTKLEPKYFTLFSKRKTLDKLTTDSSLSKKLK